jgi:hypothetical protein
MPVERLKRLGRIYRDQGLGGIGRKVFRKAGLGPDPNGPVTDAWSEYLSWLSYANAGMLTRGNVDCVDYAMRHLPSDAPLVEIGSFCGLSTNIITYLKRKHGATNRLVTCDRWDFEGSESGGNLGDCAWIDRTQYKTFVRDTYMRNARFFSGPDLPYTIELFSNDFFKAWEAGETRADVFGREVRLGGPIAFCFIDGNHTYEFARHDFENTDRHLQPGGFILFDDSGDGNEWGVCKLVAEIAAAGRYELVANNPNYFFKKRG